jgi:long-subunit fatty acid transport protein
MRARIVVLALIAPAIARAGGFELVEQSPAGVATVGAQTAIGDTPSTVFYNAAGVVWGRGFAAEAGLVAMNTQVNVRTPSDSFSSVGGIALPAIYIAQRLGPYIGAGIGVFSDFAESLAYPERFAALHPGFGQSIELRTTTVNPTFAFRPWWWLAIGFGIDIMPSSLDLAIGQLPGTIASGSMTATGFGANVGVLIEFVPRCLRFGFSYRGAIDLDFAGAGFQGNHASATLSLPDRFSFALSSRPARGLQLDTDFHVALSSQTKSLDLKFDDPNMTVVPLELNQRDSYGVRSGAEYRFLDGKMVARLGLGWDRSPVRRGWLGPLTPDSDRVVIGLGVGATMGLLSIDAGYSAQIVLARTSSNPVPGMTSYDALRHLIAISLTVRLPRLGPYVNIPEYRR